MSSAEPQQLTEMDASYPYFNPTSPHPLPHQDKVPTVLSHELQEDTATITIQNHGAKVKRVDLIYTTNPGHKYEEWFRKKATLQDQTKATATLPEGTTHYYLNLIDENKFLRSYPEVTQKGKSFADSALSVTSKTTEKKNVDPKPKTDRSKTFKRLDTNNDNTITRTEYKAGMNPSSPDLDKRFDRFDKNSDDKLTQNKFLNP